MKSSWTEGAKFFVSKLPTDDDEDAIGERMVKFRENRYRIKHWVIKKKIDQNRERLNSRRRNFTKGKSGK